MATIVEIRALARIAKHKNTANPKAFLTSLLVAIYDSNIVDGRVVISTMEAGGTVTFQIPHGMSPMEMAAAVEETIEWLEQQPDPANPVLSGRRLLRLNASFAKARI